MRNRLGKEIGKENLRVYCTKTGKLKKEIRVGKYLGGGKWEYHWESEAKFKRKEKKAVARISKKFK